MSVEKVREILYQVLTADENADRPENLIPDIVAKQQMGVNVSSAVTKNGGVKIFQLQNIVQKKVVHHIVNALKVLDAMSPLQFELQKVINAESMKPKGKVIKTIDDLIEEALDNGSSYQDFLNTVGKQFISAAIVQHQTCKETAVAIKISYSKLMQVKRSINSLE